MSFCKHSLLNRFVASKVLLAFVLIGCAGQPQPVKYYTLSSITPDETEESRPNLAGVTLGVGPVTIPDALKRTQIATRPQINRFEYSDSHQWAGMLENNVSATLAENLSVLLGSEQVGVYPWLPHVQPDYTVALDIARFDGDLSGDVVLSVRWLVKRTGQKDAITGGGNKFTVSVKAPTYDALVEAESKALALFSDFLAGKIGSLH